MCSSTRKAATLPAIRHSQPAKNLKELEREYDFALDERLQFIVYNSLTDFRQSNIGLDGLGGDNNIGGLTRIVGTKIFVYYEGDHTKLDQQIRSGIAHVVIDQMMFGGKLARNVAQFHLPYAATVVHRWDHLLP
jgi:hypothetical protein